MQGGQVVMQGPQQCAPPEAGSQTRERLGELDAGKGGGDGTEGTADLGWSERLGVPGVEVAGPARLEQQDHAAGRGGMRPRDSALGVERGPVGLGQAGGTEAAKPQKIAA